MYVYLVAKVPRLTLVIIIIIVTNLVVAMYYGIK